MLQQAALHHKGSCRLISVAASSRSGCGAADLSAHVTGRLNQLSLTEKNCEDDPKLETGKHDILGFWFDAKDLLIPITFYLT